VNVNFHPADKYPACKGGNITCVIHRIRTCYTKKEREMGSLRDISLMKKNYKIRKYCMFQIYKACTNTIHKISLDYARNLWDQKENIHNSGTAIYCSLQQSFLSFEIQFDPKSKNPLPKILHL
jgi:hypothetical protein